MKRKTAKEILSESFRELVEMKPVDKTTIQEIVDNCDYSTATFYRHFKDKYDLIAWDYVHRTETIVAKVGLDAYQWEDTWTDGMKFFSENKTYIQNLLRNTSGHDAFVRHMSKGNVEHLTKCILRLNGKESLSPDIETYIQIYCYGTAQMLCEWFLGKTDHSGEHLAELFTKALPEPLKKFIVNDKIICRSL